ncbi:MAG: hypothetical protein U0905_01850 [Pirellulales bacterium]
MRSTLSSLARIRGDSRLIHSVVALQGGFSPLHCNRWLMCSAQLLAVASDSLASQIARRSSFAS